jgi:transcriptional regulator with XRE-family HTH domain
MQLGRTLSSVAIDAGLSVPYVANLERGRGNPTLSVLESLADALDLPLAAMANDGGTEVGPPSMPRGLGELVAGDRFRRELRFLIRSTGLDRSDLRARLIRGLTGFGEACPRPLTDVDWHRGLDALVLTLRRA